MEGISEMKRGSKPGYITMLVLNALGVIALTIITAVNLNVYANDEIDYDLDISPSNWVFLIWVAVYISLATVAVYALTLCCRYNSITGGLFYCDPPFLPPTFFAVLLLSHAFSVLWAYSIDSGYLIAAFLALSCLWFCLQICIYFSVRLLWNYESELPRSEMWTNVVLVQNGLGIYATWTFIWAIINMGFLLNYNDDVSMANTCWICLILLLIYLVLYFLFEVIISPVSLRYQVSPYLTYIWCVSGIVSNDDSSGEDYRVLAVILLVVSVVALLVKCAISSARAKQSKTTLELRN